MSRSPLAAPQGPAALTLPRAALAGLALVGLAAFGCRSFPDARPVVVPAEAAGRTLVLDEDARARGEGLRVHLLQVGETLVTFDQFFSGHDGAVGFSGLWRMKTDERRFWAPVMCVLVVHPEHGPVLFDTCVSPAQNAPGYYEGIAANVHSDDINRIPKEQELLRQLQALGVAPGDVRHVVVSHLHEDHVGNVSRFPNATLHIARAEWEQREHSPLFFPIYYEKSWAGTKAVAPLAFDDGALGPFPAVEDLFEDGTLIVLPTHGHTPGHASLLVNAGDALFVVSGDAFYTLRHLDPASLAAFGAYDEAWQELTLDAVRRLKALRAHFPSTPVLYLAQHDPFPGTRERWLAALADGQLSPEEQQDLLAHEASLFDERGTLRPEAQPRFVPPAEGAPEVEGIGPVGEVR